MSSNRNMKQLKLPKILIAMNTMNSGGIEKSVVTLLKSLEGKDVDITLLLNKKTGIYLNAIPHGVKIREINYKQEIINEKQYGKKKFLRHLLFRLRLLSLLKFYGIFNKEEKLAHDDKLILRCRRYHKGIIKDDVFDSEYDLAVAYADFEQMILVADHIKANRKIAFFHTQIEGLTSNIRKYISIFNLFDSLYCVSNDLKVSLEKNFPEYLQKIHIFPHILDVESIKKSGKEYNADWRNDTVRILSVGRLQRQKGFDLIPAIAMKLRDSGVDFQWSIIGEGPLRESIQRDIVRYGLEEYITLHGVKENPYPYFASCDIYVQTSRYEGYCLTLAEARVFAKPIVSTRFDGSNEQLNNGKYGIIVDCDTISIFTAVHKLIVDTKLRSNYTEKLSAQHIDNKEGAEIFMNEVFLATK